MEAALDLSFVYEETAPLYSKKYGRPPIDPVVIVKYLLVGFLYGIPSERQIEQRRGAGAAGSADRQTAEKAHKADQAGQSPLPQARQPHRSGGRAPEASGKAGGAALPVPSGGRQRLWHHRGTNRDPGRRQRFCPIS